MQHLQVTLLFLLFLSRCSLSLQAKPSRRYLLQEREHSRSHDDWTETPVLPAPQPAPVPVPAPMPAPKPAQVPVAVPVPAPMPAPVPAPPSPRCWYCLETVSPAPKPSTATPAAAAVPEVASPAPASVATPRPQQQPMPTAAVSPAKPTAQQQQLQQQPLPRPLQPTPAPAPVPQPAFKPAAQGPATVVAGFHPAELPQLPQPVEPAALPPTATPVAAAVPLPLPPPAVTPAATPPPASLPVLPPAAAPVLQPPAVQAPVTPAATPGAAKPLPVPAPARTPPPWQPPAAVPVLVGTATFLAPAAWSSETGPRMKRCTLVDGEALPAGRLCTAQHLSSDGGQQPKLFQPKGNAATNPVEFNLSLTAACRLLSFEGIGSGSVHISGDNDAAKAQCWTGKSWMTGNYWRVLACCHYEATQEQPGSR